MCAAPVVIPSRLADITDEWLESVLAVAGGPCRVAAVRRRRIGTDRGIGSQVVRVELEYQPDAPSLPRSLIVKLPLPDAGVTEVERNEARFYAELAPHVPFATPHCFYTAVDEAANRAVLVLEDLRGLRACGDVKGIAGRDAERVVETLAVFHARFWGRVDTFDWVRDARARAAVHESWLATNLGASLALLRQQLDPERLRLCRSLAGTPRAIVERLDAEPRTLVHMDYRADNMFLDAGGRVWLFDNGVLSRLRGPADLGGFYGTSLANSVRRKHGEHLLGQYLSTLRRHGVSDYAETTFLGDLRLGLLRWLAYAVALLPELEVRSGRPRRILEAWIDRFTRAALELDAPLALE